MVGRRLFFEVVQRRGGYDGYGAANAPVRMAAQRRAVALATSHTDAAKEESRERNAIADPQASLS